MIKDIDLKNYDLISTYVGSEFLDRLDDSWIKVVILREPVARLRSSYWNLRSDRDNTSTAAIFAKTHGYAGYLASRDPAIIYQTTNVQAWTVLGDRSIFYRQKCARLSEDQIAVLMHERLARYDFIGFTETLEEFWAAFCNHFRWPVSPLPKLRANPPFFMKEPAPFVDLEFHTHLDYNLIEAARSISTSIAQPPRVGFSSSDISPRAGASFSRTRRNDARPALERGET
jgi:hypothetical protein